MPQLTVLLPVRNGERFLSEAIDSTVRALPQDAELLVIDDGSQDGSSVIAGRAADQDRRVRMLRREQGTGLPAALNAGIAASDSRFVARMDADDRCLPTRFRRQLAALRHADFVFGSSLLMDETGRVTGVSSPLPITPRAARYHLLVGNYFSHPTMACRRERLDSLGGYTATTVEDYELWLRAVAAGSAMRQSPIPAIAYRMHEAQVTKQWRLEAPDPVLDAAYLRLLPPELRDVTASLRHAAITRTRPEAADRAAWHRLAAWLDREATRLPPVDRMMLRLRVSSVSRGMPA